jgi:predicted Zn-dependent protease
LGKKDLEIGRERYLKEINGIIFGENPRQGFVEENVFYHPDLKFKFPVPAGWKLNNLPSQVQMIDAEQKGIILFTLAGSGSAKNASDQFIEKTKAKVAKNEATKVNGLNARKVFSEIADNSNILRIQSYFIEMSEQVYVFHGFSSSTEFDNYQSTYTKTMMGFNQLKDKAKLNVQPDRIEIVSTAKAGKLKDVLNNYNVPAEGQENIALLNGINLEDQIKANTIIKLIKKGK